MQKRGKFVKLDLPPSIYKNTTWAIRLNIVAVEWDEESTNKEGIESKFTGVTVITLKFGKATHAKDYIFASDEEVKKAWGE